MPRTKIKNAKCVVVKIGSRVLLEDDGKPNYAHIAHLVEQIAHLHKKGYEVIFVTSGAMGSGMEALGIKKRPSDLPTLQACAAIGQLRLMRTYEDLFQKFGCMVAQVLLTHDDLKSRERHLNIKHTFRALLQKKVIPIVNENDTVSVKEIKFGDNDVLASMVAMLLESQVLVLLTTANGFMITKENGEQECLSHIEEIDEKLLSHVHEHKVGISLGGMKSKLIAASNMNHVGGVAVIAPGMAKNVLMEVFSGANIGTVVGQGFRREKSLTMPGKKRWIAFYNRPTGSIVVDEGAKKALKENGKSLLPVGIKSVEGAFAFGAVIEIKDSLGQIFAKGITQFNSAEIAKIKGHDSTQIGDILGHHHYDEVVHRDNLVILP